MSAPGFSRLAPLFLIAPHRGFTVHLLKNHCSFYHGTPCPHLAPDTVLPLIFTPQFTPRPAIRSITPESGSAGRGETICSRRVAQIAFGANANLENLTWTFDHYNTPDHPVSQDFIILPGYLPNCDVAACNIGYWGTSTQAFSRRDKTGTCAVISKEPSARLPFSSSMHHRSKLCTDRRGLSARTTPLPVSAAASAT